MPSKEILGITVELAADATQLNKELKKMGEGVKATQSEVAALKKSLQEEWDNSKFERAQKLAQENVQKTQKRVEELKKAYDEAVLQDNKEAVENLTRELTFAENTARRFVKTANEINNLKFDKIAANLDKVGQGFTNVGKALMPVTAAVTAGMTLSAKAAIDYEAAFTGVTKTVDGTELQLASLNKEIRQMATEIPVTAVELANIAASAGQLGIKTETITGFTKTIADLGVATNLVGEEAATTLAKFANITQMPQENFDRLGSAIVALGNDSATTEKDIASMAMRIAAAGSQAGLTEADILAISSALSSVGIEAEAGGSAFSKTINDINKAVLTGGAELKKYASVAEMTGEEFKKLFKENPAEALTKFIEGLGKAGNETILVLDSLDINEKRQIDTLSRAAGAGDTFRNSIELATQSKLEQQLKQLEQQTANRITETTLQNSILSSEYVANTYNNHTATTTNNNNSKQIAITVNAPSASYTVAQLTRIAEDAIKKALG